MLAISNERDLQLARIGAAWRDGYAAALDDLAEMIGGRIWPEHPTELEERRWGPLGREHFARPRRGDYPGGGEQ